MISEGHSWRVLALRLALLFLVAGALGWWSGSVWAGLFLACFGVLVWQFRQQARLHRWLRDARSMHPPAATGLWGDIFNAIYRLQRRQLQRRQRLAAILQGVRETINAMPDAAIILQASGEMRWWNTRASDLFGLRWPGDEGQRIDNLIRHPRFIDFIARLPVSGSEADEESVDAQDADDVAIELPSPLDERVMLEIRLIPYGDGQSLLLARDISRLYRLEAMRRDFVANVSHELRTPLTVVRGVTETLQDTALSDAPALQRPLQLIDEQAERMQRLVEDLLTLSRLETEESVKRREPVNVPALLGRVIDAARALADDAGHQLDVDIDASLWLLGDESDLRSVFANLVFNAIKYTLQPGRISVRWWRAADGARFSVSDTGIGIAPRHIARITERFYRVDVGRSRKTGGTGLGLAIVKHVLSRYDSRLEIVSELGAGSNFGCCFSSDLVVDEEALLSVGSG